ncbi:MAG TPA: acetyl-CoA carboxylase biotin carboxylase subunit [Gemmatimonadota bacterium]|nr:acetyl-CoA carboxylase biotin carboxylase subunit [Gemmatimonadota bacterium]
MTLTTVLIANRGEIAVRVARACRELGLRSVAVYSEADAGAPHVAAADEAVAIGPAEAARSYLDVDALLTACEATGADAVHPGYGFLAESAEFARRVEAAGLVFVGPPAAAIAAMGDKTAARSRMIAAGVPVVPGTERALDSAAEAAEAADEIGYPVLLKAAAGGGGKGMRVVESPDTLAAAFEAAGREATQAFGDGRVYLERYLERPRHIEIQVLGDAHGRLIHLGERECSIQRRHQKLIEEAPSPVLDADLRERMGAVACEAARAVDYVGAGTVEFMFQDGEFWFLEMNTRIQVEHPVTELVTGVDLVQWQLRIAAGESLTVPDEAARPRGHAIECRIGGEDPVAGFLPATGTVRAIDLPSGPGVRWDGGVEAGTVVGLHYDPLLGKLLARAPSRDEAIERMKRALGELRIAGIRTTIPFHLAVMDEPDFRAGDVSIRYIEEHSDLLEAGGDWTFEAALAAAAWLEDARRSGAGVAAAGGAPAASARDAIAASGAPPVERSAWQRALEGDR